MAQTKQEMLDAVETAIQALMSGGAVQEYTINGRSIKKFSLQELINWRATLKAEIAASTNTRTYVQFEDPL